jgi:hypothetical protein
MIRIMRRFLFALPVTPAFEWSSLRRILNAERAGTDSKAT